MARATVYKGSASLVCTEEESMTNVDPLRIPIKVEPASPPTVLAPNENHETPFDTVASASTSSRLETPSLASSADGETLTNSRLRPRHSTQGPSRVSSSNIAQRVVESHEPVSNSDEFRKFSLRSKSAKETGKSHGFTCKVCSVTMSSSGALKRHQRYYADQKVTCKICHKMVGTRQQWVTHCQVAHARTLKLHKGSPCQYCPLVFKAKQNLKQHILHLHGTSSTRRTPGNSSPVSENSQTGDVSKSARSARKRKRDHVTEEKEHDGVLLVPSSSLQTKPEHLSPNHDPPASRSSSLSYSGEQSCSFASSNTPFVKIHAIPHEVEALLSDYGDTPTKKRKRDDHLDIPQGEIDVKCLRSGKTVSVKRSRTSSESADVRSNEKITASPSIARRGSHALLANSPKITQTPVTLITRKWAMAKMRYKCRECYVRLTRIDHAKKHDNIDQVGHSEEIQPVYPPTSSEIHLSPGRSIDVQLRNLEIALKKLEVPENPTTNSLKVCSPILQTASNSTNMIYRSSVCRTRFTTKQKLLSHYLCFHTNTRQDECGVCRGHFANSKRLKKHLLLHCIKIIRSKQDHSPIDLKGPCEKYKKKYACKGCKKRFWLSSCLARHEDFCRSRRKVEEPTPQPLESHLETRRVSPRKTDSIPPMASHFVEAEDVEEEMMIDNSRLLSSTERDPFEDSALDVPSQTTVINASTGNQWWHKKIPFGIPAFPCPVCHTNCQSQGTLAEHLRKFKQRHPCRCSTCGTLFPTKGLFSAHLKQAHTLEQSPHQLRCPICDHHCTAKKYLRSHLLHIHWDQINNNIDEWHQPHANYEMKCHVCKLIFHNRKRFVEHIMYYFEDEQYSCDICDKRFIGKFRCHHHWKTVHYSTEMQDAYTHHCRVCGEGFMYKSHLRSHILHVHDFVSDESLLENSHLNKAGLYVCPTCEQSFPSSSLFAQHEDEYSNDGQWKCAKCDRRFRASSVLNNHFRATHMGSNDVGKCLMCGEGISSKIFWMSHIKHAHENPNNQPSEFCLENSCILDDLLQVPLSRAGVNGSNTSTSTYTLPIDSPESEMLGDEDDNMSVTEIAPLNIEYTCAICDEKFASAPQLKAHKATHLMNGVSNHSVDQQNQQLTHSSVVTAGLFEIIDPGRCKMVPINNLLVGPVEISPTIVSSPDNEKTYYVYPTKDLPCNFSIANIYSVGLDEYEQLTNNQLPQKNHINVSDNSNANNISTAQAPKCDVCHISFNDLKTLQRHQIRYSNMGDYICEVCGRRFKWMRAYRTHVVKHHRKKEGINPCYYCEKCDEVFATRNSRLMHFAHIHNDTYSVCDGDSMSSELQPTEDTNSASQPVQPTGLDIQQIDLIENEREHRQHRPAPKTSASVKPTVIQDKAQNSNRPVDMVSDLCPIVCTICHLQCISIEFLVSHIENVHGIYVSPSKQPLQNQPNQNTSGNTQCEQNIIQSNFASNQDTRRQLVDPVGKSDTEPLYYQCKSCKLQFASEFALVVHLRTAHAKNDVSPRLYNLKATNVGNLDRISLKSPVVLNNKQNRNIDGVIPKKPSYDVHNHLDSTKEPIRNERPMDLSNKSENVILSKVHLQRVSAKPYRIVGGTDSQGNVQLISVQKKDLLHLTRNCLQKINKSTEGSNDRL